MLSQAGNAQDSGEDRIRRTAGVGSDRGWHASGAFGNQAGRSRGPRRRGQRRGRRVLPRRRSRTGSPNCWRTAHPWSSTSPSVGFLDSTGLGALVAARTTAAEKGAALPLVCTHQRILKLFTITGLDGVFRIHDSVDGALAGLDDPAGNAEDTDGAGVANVDGD